MREDGRMAVYTFPLGDEIKKLAENAINEAIKNKFVPVVRCADCKHRGNDFECPLAPIGLGVPDDFFCADGERRNDE